MRTTRQLIYSIVIVSMLLSSISPARLSAAPLKPPIAGELQPLLSATNPLLVPSDYLVYVAPPGAQPLLREIPADLTTLYNTEAEIQTPVGPYRTTVTIRGTADLARLKKMGATILATTKTTATVIVDRLQLEELTKLRFSPRDTELTDRLQVTGGTRLATAATSAQILTATAVDSDNDGLNDTEEGWWCTNPNNPNTDGDPQGYTDGQEVHGVLDFTLSRSVRWGYGPPFGPPNAWPVWNQPGGCNDGDYDTIPDQAEVFMVGTKVPEESTDHDKFDDGQELFGVTYCPGAPTSCGYGNYPRIEYWSYIKATMPNWVVPPGDNPFVAAFPVPEVSVTPGSWHVERVTTITTSQGQMTQSEKTYGSSVMRGQSTSIANTVNWNNWEEVSQAVETPLGQSSMARAASAPRGDILKGVFGVAKIAGGIVAPVASCAAAAAGTVYSVGTLAIPAGYVCAGTVAGGLGAIYSGFRDIGDALKSDNVQPQQVYNINNSSSATASAEANASITLNQNFDFQGVVDSLDGVQYAISQQGALLSRGLHDVSVAISQPRLTETRTSGRSWGGAQTVTNEEYEEHTLSESNAFTSGENWSTAWATDSSHAANLTFNYSVKNSGTEYARELTNVIFNIYLGDDKTPIISYPAWQQFANGKLENIFPGTSNNFASTAVPLTLEQMKRIDMGERLTVVLEDFSYGADELFYQDATSGGLTVYIEDGVDDGNELVDAYVIPTWGTESVQDVLTRYFPAGYDDGGNLNSLWTPEFNGINPPTFNEHFLSDIAWWNIYLTQSDAGNTPLKDLNAQAGSAILFRFNRDSDRDGYSDRVEMEYHTDKNNPASHPQPEVLAGYVKSQSGNTVTVKLVLENTGTFDAYGIDAVMYSPDGTTAITNNTVGGNGRVRSGGRAVVGSLVKAPALTGWGSNTAKPYSGGQYSGAADRTYTFSVTTPGVIGQGSTAMSWSDGSGGNGTLDLGSSYHAPLPKDVAQGLQIGFNTGSIAAGTSFTVDALTPRDTFTFNVNSESYTMPVIVVSFSDPQGSHRFITPIELPNLDTKLAPAYAGQMLKNISLDIVTTNPVAPASSNTTNLIVNSPHSAAIQGGHLYLDFVSNGTVVAHIDNAVTLQPGPTVFPVTWATSAFTQTYNADNDNILIAFWTDAQGNIIDSAARPLNTFADDPDPQFNLGFGSSTARLLNREPSVPASDVTWNFGTVTQGETVQQTFTIANTGEVPLTIGINNADPALTVSNISGIVAIAPSASQNIVVQLNTTNVSGAINKTITVRSNDPVSPQTNIIIIGNVNAPGAQAAAFNVTNRPLDKTVRVYGSVAQYSTVDFTHGIQPDTVTIEPCKVYAADGTTLKGVGKYCADFGGAVSTSELFGDGSDGPLTVTSNPTIINLYAALVSTVNAGQTSLNLVSNPGFLPNQEILLHQRRGISAGTWETNTIASVVGNTLSLKRPIVHTYTQGGNSRAQIVSVPHYTNVTVQNGGVLTVPAWDTYTGGVLIFRANGSVTVQTGGLISAKAKGFGQPPVQATDSNDGKQGESELGEGLVGNTAPNGMGGGAGRGQGDGDRGPGGGGGYASPGSDGTHAGRYGRGGLTAGLEDLSLLLFGGGAGNGGGTSNGNDTVPGAGGGIVYISSADLLILGQIDAGGGNGTNGDSGAGGGAGGSIKIIGSKITLGASLVSAIGGSGGSGGGGYNGGNGGNGRIRVEYCNTLSGSTNPATSTQKLTCYVAENITNVSFGTGADGPLTVTTNQAINNTRTALSATSNAGQATLNVGSTSGFAVGQEVLIHQTQGTGAGNYEFGKIASIGAGTLTLHANLQNIYTQGGNSRAQVVRVPHYTVVTVQSGGTLTAPPWDGGTGGVLALRARDAFNVLTGGQVTVSALGNRGGSRGTSQSEPGEQGESPLGLGARNGNRNSTGGGGGSGDGGNPDLNGGGGGGGGHGAFGNDGYNTNTGYNGQGGNAIGDNGSAQVFFGGGGGSGGNDNNDALSGSGGRGGGIIIIYGLGVNTSGQILANGANGNDSTSCSGSGGGGAGGTIKLIAKDMTIGTDRILSQGGQGGNTGDCSGGGHGGQGSIGRIRLEYQNIVSGWATNPSASTQQVAFYIAETDSNIVHFTVPDAVTNGQNYIMQFARRLTFSGAGNQLTYTRVVSQTHASATMDALITNVGAGGATTLTIDIGDDGTIDYTYNGNITQPTTLNIPNVASAFNAFITTHTASGGNVDVPIRVNINRQADVLLTNLGLTPGAGIDLAVGAGDLVIGNTNASEGDTVPLTATVHNNGSQTASSVVVAFYAGNPQSGGQLLGSAFINSITPGGTGTRTFDWVTNGFTGTQTIFAFADPQDAIGESLENNNITSQAVYVKTKPDLRVASIALDRTDRVVGESINVSLVISNTGETNAGTSTTRVEYRGEHGNTGSQDLTTGTVVATNTLTLTTTLSPTLFGTHIITVTADVGNAVNESAETNNVMTRNVYIGLAPTTIDAGGSGDSVYNATNGFGYLNGATYDFGTPSGAITKTVRYDGTGSVQYRFDGLQPSRFYHLDGIFYQEGDDFTQSVWFDAFDSGAVITMTNSTVSTASIIIPTNAYTDTTTVVSIQRSGATGSPAFVSQLTLTPIEYVYLDTGGTSDVAYEPARGYGYLNGYSGGSGNAVGTYRTVFTNTVFYEFDNLNPAKAYSVDLTFYDSGGSTRQQSVTADGTTICGPFTLSTTLKPQCAIPTSAYSDGRVVIGIVRNNGSGPFVNEIALEEKTMDVSGPVQKATTTTVTSSLTLSTFGQSVTFTATVTTVPPGGGTPTGTVTFKDGAATLGTGTLTDGQATLTNSALTVGSHPITAIYDGNSGFTGSTSAAMTQTVGKATPNIAIAAAPSPSVWGQAVTFTATVTSTVGSPTGSVTFKDGTTTLGTGVLSSGQATYITTALAVASHSITAYYPGDDHFNEITSTVLTQIVNPASTSTAMIAAPNPSLVGQTVTLTATVSALAPGAGTPTGTITFKDESNILATGSLSAGKVVTTTTALATGPHSLTAIYGGDTNFGGSTSSVWSQTVGKISTTITVTSSANASVFGQGVTFTATVTSTVQGAGTPGGTIQFRIDGADWGTPVTLVGGIATSVMASSLSVGNHAITATYSGDGNFAEGTGALSSGQTVNKASTSATVSTSKANSIFGESVTFTATVNVVPPGSGTPTGTVQFEDNSTPIGNPQSLSGNTASFTTNALGAGPHTITAVYAGNTNFNTSTSAGLTQTVTKANSTTSLVSSKSTTVLGESVTFTATVSSTLVPTGTVTFKDGATALITRTLDTSGAATYTLASLAVGSHPITAVYNGNSNVNTSTSSALTQTVNKANTTTALVSSSSSSVVGQSVTFTATVTAVSPGAGIPAGTVTFKDGASTLGTGTLNTSGVATYVTSALTIAASPHTITAVYGGDASFVGSTSSTMNQTVGKANTSTTLTSTANPSNSGQTVTFTATVSVVVPGSGTPSGSVQFQVDGANLGSPVSLSGGKAGISTSQLSAGAHTITAIYSGDPNFNGSSASGGQDVNKASPTVTVTSSPNPSMVGQSATFTVNVTSTLGVPAGNVTFKDGTTILGTRTLESGSATFSTSTLSAGNHSISVVYSGDSTFASANGNLSGGHQVNSPVPTLSSIGPNSAATGGPAFTLTVTGTNFVNGATLKWDGTDLPTTVVSSTKITATVFGAKIAAVGTAYVTVVNPAPGGGASNARAFWTTSTGAAVTNSDVGTSTTSGGTATATTGGTNGVTASASGSGTVSVAHYASNPGSAPSFSSTGAYVDVHVAPGSTFTSLTIVDCNLNGGNVVYWWNGSTWVIASNQSYNPTTQCVTITVNSSTSPNLTDLTGTPFTPATDTTAPTANATATTSGGAYTFGNWAKQDVQVTLTATDEVGGSGVKQITYSATGAQPISSTTVNGASTTFTIDMEGVTTISYYATDLANNPGTPQTATVKLDKTAPAITITTPADGATYTLNQVVTANYGCTDLPIAANSGVATCAGPVASGANVDTSSNGTKTFTVNATDNLGNTTSRTNTYTVTSAPTINIYLPYITK